MIVLDKVVLVPFQEHVRPAHLENLVQRALRPDAVLLLDIPVEQGLERARGRGELDRFEQEDIAFFERVRTTYLQRAKNNDDYHVLDASQPLEQVQAQLKTVLNQLKARLV